MATLYASAVAARVRTLLNDAGKVRWTDDELIGWLNDAQLAIAAVRPEASVKTAAFETAAGVRQTLPAEALGLIDVPCNTNGSAVTYVERPDLDLIDPTWRATAPVDGAVAIHYTADERDPRTFYVYPAVPSNTSLDLVYPITPAAIPVTAIDGTGPDALISIDDTWFNSLVDFVMFRALAKSTETGAMQRAALYGASFEQRTGAKIGASRMIAPDKHTAAAEQVEQLK